MSENVAILGTHLDVPRECVEQWMLGQCEVSVTNSYTNQTTVYRLYSDGGPGRILLPRAVPFGQELLAKMDCIQDNRLAGEPMRPLTHAVTPRDGQTAGIDFLARGKSGILKADCGTGKTVMGLAAIARLGRKAMVIVHNEALRDQWCEEAIAHLGLARKEILFVQGKDSPMPTSETQLAVGLVQSLSSVKYSDWFYQMFGVVLIDESHRTGAPTWQQAIQRFPASIRLAVTATPYRKDKMERVLFFHVSPQIQEIKLARLRARVFTISSGVEVPDEVMQKSWEPKPNLARILTFLGNHRGRNTLITNAVEKAVRGDRQVLVIADRRKQIDILREMVGDRGITDVGILVGGQSEAKRVAARAHQVVIAIQHFGKEALNLPWCSCVIFASPFADKNRLQQSIGRAERLTENGAEGEAPGFLNGAGKKSPMVLDVIDEPGYLKGLAKHRMRLYREMGYAVTAGKVGSTIQ